MLPAPQAIPSCTIVIPTCQRTPQLRACLAAIAASRFPPAQLEVIVVDDSGLGGPELTSALALLPPPIRSQLLTSPRLGPAAARNCGAAAASGDLLAFLDDDCHPSPSWLPTLCGAIGPSESLAAGGRALTRPSSNRWSAAGQHIKDLVYTYYNANPPHAAFLSSNNFIVPKAAFLSLGGFNQRFRTAEDRDFCRRWLAAGHQLAYLPHALVYHDHDLTLPGFLHRYFQYGRGAFRFLRSSSPTTQTKSVRGFYASLPQLLTAVSQSDGAPARLVLFAELILWQAANTAGFLYEALTRTLGPLT